MYLGTDTHSIDGSADHERYGSQMMPQYVLSEASLPEMFTPLPPGRIALS
jgi:hypothetical protein